MFYYLQKNFATFYSATGTKSPTSLSHRKHLQHQRPSICLSLTKERRLPRQLCTGNIALRK